MKYTPEQTKENRKQGEEALLSEEYQQFTHGLTSQDGFEYCCLGVACDISELGGWEGTSYEIENGSSDDAILPDEVREWLGLASPEGNFKDEDGTETSLIYLNDNGISFDVIAAIIADEPNELIAV